MDASEQDRMREMEAEMALFEQEVLGGPSPPATATLISRPVIATNTYQQVQQTLQARAASIPPPCPPPPHPVIGPFIPYRAPPAPPPRPAFVPHVLQRQGPGPRMVPPRPSPPGPPPPPAPPQHVMLPPAHFPPPQVLPMLPISHNSTPKMNPSIIQAPPTVYFAHTLRTQEEVTTAGHTAAHSAGLGDDNLVPVTTAPEESSTVIGPQLPERGGETDGGEGALGTGKKGKVKTAKGNKKGGEKKGKKGSDKPKKSLRTASGITWEDQSLLEWDANDFRIFCGDLGNEVSDDTLTRAFSRYASFLRAKVVRDKRTGKTKGYGFVSFRDPMDFTRAMREMNGKYVGSRPIKLRKSTWRDRNLDTVRKKTKERRRLGLGHGLLPGFK